jgi:hypothetical protein
MNALRQQQVRRDLTRPPDPLAVCRLLRRVSRNLERLIFPSPQHIELLEYILNQEKKKMSKRLHIVPRGNGWGVRRENAERDSAHTNTQREAAERAAEIARREGGEVIIHRPDGKIRDSDSYGNDPFPPEDKKH